MTDRYPVEAASDREVSPPGARWCVPATWGSGVARTGPAGSGGGGGSLPRQLLAIDDDRADGGALEGGQDRVGVADEHDRELVRADVLSGCLLDIGIRDGLDGRAVSIELVPRQPVDQEAGDMLLAARLERTLIPPAGLGDVSGLRLVTRKGDRSKPKAEEGGDETRAQDMKADRKRERDRLQRELAQASKREHAAQRQVEKLREKLERARSALEEATRSLRAGEADVRGAKLEATRIEAALRRAESSE